MTTIRVLLADGQELARRGFGAVINAEGDLVVVGEAATGAETIDQAFATWPDVIPMEIRMPELEGIATTDSATLVCWCSPPSTSTSTSTTHSALEPQASFSKTPQPNNSSMPSASSPPAMPSSLRRSLAGSSASSPHAVILPRARPASAAVPTENAMS